MALNDMFPDCYRWRCCLYVLPWLLQSFAHAKDFQKGARVAAVGASGVLDARSETDMFEEVERGTRHHSTGFDKSSDLTGGVVRKEHEHRVPRITKKPSQVRSDSFESKQDTKLQGSAMILEWGRFADANAKEDKLHTCSRGSCLFTADRSKIKEASAVTWYLPSLDLADMPKQRPEGQLWVASMDESPCSYDASRSSSLLSLFNIAVSMSDHAHVRLCPSVSEDVLRRLDAPALSTKIKDEFRANGTGLVAYIQSNCLHHRDDFVKELEAEGIKVDSYGPCHHNKDFPEGLESLKAWSEFDKPDFYEFERRYKFAIALENCQCQDYVTEKLYRRLHLGVVPIYEPGGFDMTNWLPTPHSIINKSAFGSVKMLADELKRLDADAEAYEELLAWKAKGVRSTRLGDMLEECVKLSDECAICDEVLKQQSEGSRTSLAESPPFGICPTERDTDIESKVKYFTRLTPNLEFVPAQEKSLSVRRYSLAWMAFALTVAFIS